MLYHFQLKWLFCMAFWEIRWLLVLESTEVICTQNTFWSINHESSQRDAHTERLNVYLQIDFFFLSLIVLLSHIKCIVFHPDTLLYVMNVEVLKGVKPLVCCLSPVVRSRVCPLLNKIVGFFPFIVFSYHLFLSSNSECPVAVVSPKNVSVRCSSNISLHWN